MRWTLAMTAVTAVTPQAWTVTVTSSAPWAVLPMNRPTLLFTEVPPVLLTIPAPLPGSDGCPRVEAPSSLALYLTTGYSGLCVANATALNVAPDASPLGFGDASTCSVPVSGESWRNWPPNDIPLHTEWYRNYDGIMASVRDTNSLLLLRHGEHKNELNWLNNLLYQGLINADVDAHECFSGFNNGSFSDCQAAYNAFVSASLLNPFSPSTCFGLGPLGNSSATDLGPIAWPRDGYLNESGGKASYGVRQPGASVHWDGALTLFYIDNAFETADVWVARSPPGVTSADSFRAYNALTQKWDLPLLPPGFDKGDVMASLREGSPAGAPGSGGSPAFPLFPSSGAVHTTAARLTVGGAPTNLSLVLYDIVNYTQCFGGGESVRSGAVAGVGSRLLADQQRSRARAPPGWFAEASPDEASDCVPPWRLFIRVTEDFVVFSEPVELSLYASPGWGAAPLAYPTLLSADGTRADVIDADGFYVVGTCAQEGNGCGSTYGPLVTAARVSVSVTKEL
jgi:hypothetical protein